MVFNNVLKIEYDNGLVFKHLDGNWFKPDFTLNMTPKGAATFLTMLRDVLREGTCQRDINVAGEYEVSIASYGGTAFSISPMELQGEMSRPIGLFKYDKYMLGKSVINGVSEAIIQISGIEV